MCGASIQTYKKEQISKTCSNIAFYKQVTTDKSSKNDIRREISANEKFCHNRKAVVDMHCITFLITLLSQSLSVMTLTSGQRRVRHIFSLQMDLNVMQVNFTMNIRFITEYYLLN